MEGGGPKPKDGNRRAKIWNKKEAMPHRKSRERTEEEEETEKGKRGVYIEPFQIYSGPSREREERGTRIPKGRSGESPTKST